MNERPNHNEASPTEGGAANRDTQNLTSDEPPEPESWLTRLCSWMEDQVDDWLFSVQDTFQARVVRGLAVPIVLWAVGVYFLIGQKIGLYGLWAGARRTLLQEPPRMVLTGWGVAALGLALLCFGLCLHFHYFWRARRPRAGAVGMFISLVLTGVFLIGFVVALVQRA